jgi:hypothetical protein
MMPPTKLHLAPIPYINMMPPTKLHLAPIPYIPSFRSTHIYLAYFSSGLEGGFQHKWKTSEDRRVDGNVDFLEVCGH